MMKKILSTLVLLLAVISSNAKSIYLWNNDLFYILDSDKHTAMLSWRTNTQGGLTSKILYKGNVVISSLLTYEKEVYMVTSIDEKTFKGCKDITSLTIPQTIYRIKKDAFKDCAIENLKIESLANWCDIDFYNEESNPMDKSTNIYINNKLTDNLVLPKDISTLKKLSFYGAKFKTIDLSKSTLKNIPDSAFSRSEMNTVILPESIAEIGVRSFAYCYNLETINLPNTLSSIGTSCFYYNKKLKLEKLPETLCSLGDYAFAKCESLTNLILGKNLKSIGSGAFEFCKKLSDITIESAVDKIPSGFCAGNELLENVTISTNNIKEIEKFAFYGCKKLAAFSLPNSIRKVSHGAFAKCDALQKIQTSTLENWLNIDFTDNNNDKAPSDDILGSSGFGPGSESKGPYFAANPLYYVHKLYVGDQLLKELTIPEKITNIKDFSFYGCTSIEKINIPNTVKNIADSTFAQCANVREITLDINVIKDWFKGLSSIQSLTIEENVSNISLNAFCGCKGLKKIKWISKVKNLEVGKDAFKGCVNLTNVDINSLVLWCNIDFANDLANPISLSHTLSVDGSVINELSIPTEITRLKRYSFSGLTKISSVKIGGNLKSIETGAFKDCDGLQKVNIYDLESWCNISFESESNPLKYAHKLYCNEKEIQHLTIPKTVSDIKSYAFQGADGIISVTIPNTVSTISSLAFDGCNNIHDVASFSSYASYSYPSKPVILVPYRYIGKYRSYSRAYSIVSETTDQVSIKLSSTDKFTLNSAKISDGTLGEKQDDAFVFSDLNPNKDYCITINGSAYGHPIEGNLEIMTLAPVLDIELVEVTNTTMTIKGVHTGNIKISKEGFGDYGNGNKVCIKNLYPNQWVYCTYTITTEDGSEFSVSKGFYTKEIELATSYTATSTSCTLKGTYKNIDATITESGFGNSKSDVIKITGLDPNTSYTRTYIVRTKEGGSVSKTVTFKTKALQLETLQPKGVTNTCSVVSANSNIDDDELTAGFQWRKYDVPSSLKSNEGYATVYNGTLEGFIKNLQSTSYYKVRAFYKSQTDKYYYGEWVTFDPSDFSYFEPTVHTYKSVDIQGSSAVIKGVVLQGSDEITGQGFEYWSGGSNARQASNDKHIVYVNGQRMESEITNLAPNTVYYYRAFAKTSKNTTYGETMQFEIPITSSISQIVNNNKDKLQILVKNYNGLQVSLIGSESRCSYKVFSMAGNLVSLGTLPADGEWHHVSETKLPTGIYIIQVCDGKNNASTKIAVK